MQSRLCQSHHPLFFPLYISILTVFYSWHFTPTIVLIFFPAVKTHPSRFQKSFARTPKLCIVILTLMGAHVAGLVRAPTPTLLLALLVISPCVVMSFGAPESKSTLLKFKDLLANSKAISNWNSSTSPCSGDSGNWIGVICFNGSVWGLQLENMGLRGIIDVDSLVSLPFLRTISFMNNSFDGPMPNIKKLGTLKSVFLSNNHFSGEIPDDAFAGMGYLKKLYLANNEFMGKIPSSLSALPRLLELRLDGNQFEGHIPDFRHKGLQLVNVSNNELEGAIPASLSKMGSSSFSGNKDLCGKPLDSCSFKKPSALMIAIIVIALGLTLAAIGAVFIIFYYENQNKLGSPHGKQVEKSKSTKKKGEQHGKLSFVRDDIERFDLAELLRASAELLGSGSFGSSYKIVLLSGQEMVVKRYKQMNNVGREEFDEHMRILGRLRHPNLLPLVAYYYRKDEKLLLSDFVDNGSLASHLHGNHSAEHPALDWPTRLNIIKGIVKGLAYLYSEIPSLIVPHGHLKSSNVLLEESFEPLLADYALMPMINLDHAQQLMVAYKSPEYAHYGRTMKKTDVWCLGVLILEVLTGRFPENYLTQGYYTSDSDLASWVSSTSEVFDKEMGGMKDGEGEMLKLLNIGLACCEEVVELRWDLKEVVEKIEELKERDSDHDEGDDVHSSRAVTQDDFSFSLNG